MKNNNTFKEYVAPIVVLVAICLVITAALAATYGVTQPIIEENSIKAANEIRRGSSRSFPSKKSADRIRYL